ALGRGAVRLGDDALAALLAYPWPGNIRELRNEISRAVALGEGEEMTAAAFSSRVLQGQAGRSVQAQAQALPSSGTLAERLDAVEAMLLRETLLRHRWNKTRAALELGLSRVGLRGKMKRFGLED
ncbi:MAG: helix-turn-helix domain-containing protein, partial [Gammaproteobacteria bacterium]